MLYVGATLMIGASIYGFVDYKQTRQKEEFTKMYESEKSKAPAVAEEKNVVVAEKKEPVAVVKKTKMPVSKKSPVIKKAVKEEEVIPAIKPISEDAKITDKETKTIEKTTVNATASGKTVIKKKKKKINSKIFSRAPLREEEEIVIEPAKDVKKAESKGQ